MIMQVIAKVNQRRLSEIVYIFTAYMLNKAIDFYYNLRYNKSTKRSGYEETSKGKAVSPMYDEASVSHLYGGLHTVRSAS